MTNISRRSLIMGMATLPLAQHAFSQSGHLGEDKCGTDKCIPHTTYCHPAEPQCNGGDGDCVTQDTLNIIFHGLFIFVTRDDGIEVLTPQVQEHVYGGGNWYQEYRLREETYILSLPKSSPKRVKRPASLQPSCGFRMTDRILICSSKLDDIDPDDNTYCTFQLPFPDEIIPLGTFIGDGSDLGPMLFRGQDYDLVKHIKLLGSAYVFTYLLGKLSDTQRSQIGLSYLPWEPKVNALGAYNLHLFAAPTFQFETPSAAANHSAHSFANAIDLLPGLDLEVKRNHKVKFQPPNPVDGIFGKEQGTLRACIPQDFRFNPPAICDGPSMFII